MTFYAYSCDVARPMRRRCLALWTCLIGALIAPLYLAPPPTCLVNPLQLTCQKFSLCVSDGRGGACARFDRHLPKVTPSRNALPPPPSPQLPQDALGVLDSSQRSRLAALLEGVGLMVTEKPASPLFSTKHLEADLAKIVKVRWARRV